MQGLKLDFVSEWNPFVIKVYKSPFAPLQVSRKKSYSTEAVFWGDYTVHAEL